MTGKVPPLPPENRSDKGSGEPAHPAVSRSAQPPTVQDPDKQGQQGNTKINTTHQGYQQDR